MKPVPGSPCQNCDFSYRCADDDKTCPEYNRWFRPWLRREWRKLRRRHGMDLDFTGWRYYAPYEPTGDPAPEPEPETPQEQAFNLEAALVKLDEMHALIPKSNARRQLADFAYELGQIVETQMHMGPTEYGRRCGMNANRVASYVYGYHCPHGEVYERLKTALREKWKEIQNDRV